MKVIDKCITPVLKPLNKIGFYVSCLFYLQRPACGKWWMAFLLPTFSSSKTLVILGFGGIIIAGIDDK